MQEGADVHPLADSLGELPPDCASRLAGVKTGLESSFWTGSGRQRSIVLRQSWAPRVRLAGAPRVGGWREACGVRGEGGVGVEGWWFGEGQAQGSGLWAGAFITGHQTLGLPRCTCWTPASSFLPNHSVCRLK